MDNRYRFEKDVYLVAETLNMSLTELIKGIKIPESSFYYALKNGNPSKNVLEAFYGFAYKKGLRLNKAKEEIYLETLKKGETLLFHGSSEGIKTIDPKGSRANSDFSNGFYCGEAYASALCFVEGDPGSSVYAFKIDLSGLQKLEFQSDLEWMLSICYYRGSLKKYEGNKKLQDIIKKHNDYDVIIAPIADNKMYRIMQEFGSGKITDVQAIHALSASRLGRQYVFKSDKAIVSLKQIERMYISSPEKESSKSNSKERAYQIQTKLDLAKREYRREGKYIDEVFA